MVATITTLTRNKTDWVTAPQLRQMLREALKLNSRQITVSGGPGTRRYLIITVRDAAVDLAAVKQFAAQLSTWEMDMTDYVTGQSVSVESSKEVNAAHAAPFRAEIARSIPLVQGGGGLVLSNGTVLWCDEVQGYFITRDQVRGCYIWKSDADRLATYAVEALALQMARL
jgi:hypothetical protein